MALLFSGVDHDIISLIGRWRSDEMMRYLHVQAELIMRNFSKLMISHGNYNLLPHTDVLLYYPFCTKISPPIQPLLNILPWLPMAYGDTGPLLSA